LDSKKYSRIIWNYLETLCAFGPRNPGSDGYRETLDLIRKNFKNINILEAVFLIELDFLKGREKLKDTPIYSMIHY